MVLLGFAAGLGAGRVRSHAARLARARRRRAQAGARRSGRPNAPRLLQQTSFVSSNRNLRVFQLRRAPHVAGEPLDVWITQPPAHLTMASLCPHPASLLTRARLARRGAVRRRAAPARCAAAPADDPRASGGARCISAGVVASLLAAVDVGVAAQPRPRAARRRGDGPFGGGRDREPGRRVVEQLRARGGRARGVAPAGRALGLEAAEPAVAGVLDPESLGRGASAVVCCTGFRPRSTRRTAREGGPVRTDNLSPRREREGAGGCPRRVLLTARRLGGRTDNYKFLSAQGVLDRSSRQAELARFRFGLPISGRAACRTAGRHGPGDRAAKTRRSGCRPTRGEISRYTCRGCVEALFAKRVEPSRGDRRLPDAPKTSRTPGSREVKEEEEARRYYLLRVISRFIPHLCADSHCQPRI